MRTVFVSAGSAVQDPGDLLQGFVRGLRSCDTLEAATPLLLGASVRDADILVAAQEKYDNLVRRLRAMA